MIHKAKPGEILPSMSAHTPGPWVVGGDVDHQRNVIGPHNVTLAAVYSGLPTEKNRPNSQHVRHETRLANARLIAAAPDLLEELYRSLPFLEDMLADPCYKPGTVAARIKSIRAAIAKAQPSQPGHDANAPGP